MALARTREALHNGWDKNDPRDAQVILHMLRIGVNGQIIFPKVSWVLRVSSALPPPPAEGPFCVAALSIADAADAGK